MNNAFHWVYCCVVQIQDSIQGASTVEALACHLVAMLAIGLAVALVTRSMTTFDEG